MSAPTGALSDHPAKTARGSRALVASLVLLADRRAGRKSGWLPWTALSIGTVASLAANIATADNGIISRVIAGWPAVALLIAVKLLSGILEHRTPAPVYAGNAAVPRAVPAGSAGPSSRLGSRRSDPAASRTVLGDTALERAARAARDEMDRAGQPLTRDALAARLRAAGHPIRNAQLTPILAALRAAPTPAA